MTGLKRLKWGAYEVDLAAYGPSRGVFAAFRKAAPLVVDAGLVTRVLVDGMAGSFQDDARGARVFANYHRLLLHPSDFEELMRLRVRLHEQIGPVLRERAESMRATMTDAPAVTFAPDESATLAPGRASLVCDIRETGSLKSDRPGEVTMRFDKATAAPAPTAAPTVRLQSGPAAARMSWNGGGAVLADGARYIVGRPHDGAPGRFIALTGASTDVHRQHAWVEVRGDAVRIGRLGENPVRVAGRALQLGGETETVAWPVLVSLGEGFAVTLDRS